MDSSMIDDSVFDLEGDSDTFSPVKPKSKAAKAVPKKTTAPKAKAASKPAAKPVAKKPIQTTLKPKAAASKKRSHPDPEDEASETAMDSVLDDSFMSVTPPSAKKQKKAPAAKKQGGKPLQPLDNDVSGFDGNGDPMPNLKADSGATQKYTKLTQLEHILKRPDTYIGSVERTDRQMWVFNSVTESMEMREVHYVPGLYKIFDEILVNAADNKQNDKNMDTIKVTVSRENGEISVYNNGRGIPIEVHAKEGIYIPEMIFGHLLTSSNYDDQTDKVTGGRNGYGAKLCNIFSTEFTVETADSRSKQKYRQTWTDNMGKMGKAKITSNKSDDYTKVTFKPDFSKFGMDGIDDDFEALVKRRVYDLAGTCHGVKVALNGERIKIRNFKQYMEMYAKAINKERNLENPEDAANTAVITDTPDVRWEIGFAVSDGSFQQVSFVNSIATTSGGTHVNYVGDQIVNKLMEIVKKKNPKGVTLKNNQIRNHIFLFVNCLINNPAFTSQTKEQLTTKASAFGSKCAVSDEFLKKIAKTEAVNNILHFAQQKADQVLKKSDGSRRARMDNPKLTDANKAGTREGWKCTLILTEGDSAKGLAMAGRAIVGPDEFGVFPLRGKLLNVRDASIDQIQKNSEIQNIKKFLGLQHKREYEDTKSLRYGHLMIMTDQDHDGSHIKGLLINFLQCTFPSLLRIPEFLIEFITPIVKVYKGDPKHPTKSKSFFSMPEYQEWKEAHKHERGWEHKYYKGLGTSSTDEGQAYFQDLDRHLKEFHTMKEGEDKLIELAFSKKKADERKEWLRQFKPGTYLDHSASKITYTDFVNRELILFSMADNIRSIPSVVDGLKPGQRKILHVCFKRKIVKDRKVADIAGLVSGSTAYQHGEASLQQTIVGLAQTFVGANNINCLEPSGNFGSRLQGGSDCASARYIYTRLSPFARKIFSPLDDPLLDYNLDDERKIEPVVYCPVVPMILINGADGIGTGWSTSIPNYNPEEIVDNLRRLMRDEEPTEMKPWFRGFKGEITKITPDRYKFTGIVKQTGDTEVEVTELPIRSWTQDFKDKLEETIKAEKIPSFIKDYADYNTHVKVHFVIQMEEKHMKKTLEDGLEEKFKLSKTLATSNMVAFDREGRLRRYASVDEILRDFYWMRLEMYQRRKQYQLGDLQNQLEKLTNQARFIKMIIDGKLVVSKKKKAVLVSELKAKGFRPFPKVVDASKEGETEETLENEDDVAEDTEPGANDYDYLLGMAIWSLTQERVEKLLRQIGDKEEEISVLTALSPKDIWSKDLDDFIAEWNFQLEDDAKRSRKIANLGRRASNKLKIGAKGLGAKKRKAAGDDADDSDFEAAKPKKAAGKKIQAKGGAFDYLKPKIPLNKQQKPAAPAAPKAGVTKSQFADAVPMDQLDGASDPVEPLDIDNLGTVSQNAVAVPGGGRQQRKAATKPVKYELTSESDGDNGDDMLGDVSKMVKGIGGNPAAGSRPLFSASMSRPGSSAGARQASQKTRRITDLSDDETDFSKLVPVSSPRKSLASAGIRPTIISDGEDDSMQFDSKPIVKVSKATGKAAAKAAPKKPPAKRVAPASNKGSVATTTSKPVKKKIEDHDDDDEINELLASSPPAKPEMDSSPPRALGRPARRAAAATRKKPAWIDSEESEASDDSDNF